MTEVEEFDYEPEPGSVDALREELHSGTLTLHSFWTHRPEVEDTSENRELLKQTIQHVDQACNLIYTASKGKSVE